MALILKNGVFIHIAKTGGSWVAELLRQQGLVTAATGRSHVNLQQTISEVPSATGLPAFTFVRHPVTWWKSYWAYRMKTGWDVNHPVDKVSQSDVFEDFIRKMLELQPGYLSRRYREMTEGITYIGRFEALRESLMEILLKIGVFISPDAVYEKAEVNVASQDPSYDRRCRFSAELLAKLSEKEAYAFRRFGYGLESVLAVNPPTVWLTGIPASGKTSLAKALFRRLTEAGIKSEILDGDELRKTVSKDLDFSMEGRREQARRVADLAATFSRKGVVPVVALVSPYRADRERARIAIGSMIEVYVRCPLSICEARDSEGLYRRARIGEISGVTGLDARYEEPQSPELTIDSDQCSVEVGAERVFAEVVLRMRSFR